jgi:hypothetical protein
MKRPAPPSSQRSVQGRESTAGAGGGRKRQRRRQRCRVPPLPGRGRRDRRKIPPAPPPASPCCYRATTPTSCGCYGLLCMRDPVATPSLIWRDAVTALPRPWADQVQLWTRSARPQAASTGRLRGTAGRPGERGGCAAPPFRWTRTYSKGCARCGAVPAARRGTEEGRCKAGRRRTPLVQLAPAVTIVTYEATRRVRAPGAAARTGPSDAQLPGQAGRAWWLLRHSRRAGGEEGGAADATATPCG